MKRANQKLADIKDAFCGQGLTLANWHLNGAMEPMENFFEQNDWEPETEAIARADGGGKKE